jgi:hypothetical protein
MRMNKPTQNLIAGVLRRTSRVEMTIGATGTGATGTDEKYPHK